MMQQPLERWRLPSIAAILGALLALVATSLALTATPAAAITPGCTIANATPVSLNAANTITTTCSQDRYMNYVDLSAGDVLTVDFDARGAEGTSHFYLYNPGVTDFTLDDAYYVGRERYIYKNEMTQASFRVYETGRYIVVWTGSPRGLVFTPKVTTAPKSVGRVTGGCRIQGAPTAPNGILQYSDSENCDTYERFWTIPVAAGNRFAFEIEGYSSSHLYVYEPGVTDFTLDQTSAWCYNRYVSDRETTTCGAALKSGSYVIRAVGQMNFKPIVTKLGVPSAPRSVTAVPAPGSAKVRWAAPSNAGGTPVTRYQVKAAPGGSRCTTTGAKACTVTGLTPGASYRFTVAARNGVGWSAASAPSAAVKASYYPTKARVWRYKKATRLEVDVDPNRGWEWRVQLQKLKKGAWVNSGKAKKTVKTHRTFNPKRGTYRVTVLSKNGYSSALSNTVRIRK